MVDLIITLAFLVTTFLIKFIIPLGMVILFIYPILCLVFGGWAIVQLVLSHSKVQLT